MLIEKIIRMFNKLNCFICLKNNNKIVDAENIMLNGGLIKIDKDPVNMLLNKI